MLDTSSRPVTIIVVDLLRRHRFRYREHLCVVWIAKACQLLEQLWVTAIVGKCAIRQAPIAIGVESDATPRLGYAALVAM